MCPLLPAVLATATLTTAFARQPPDENKAEKPPAKAAPALAPGKDLPGPFHPYNVTGTRKGNFHSLISDHGLDPAVLVFIRDREASDAVKDLLHKLDALVEKNPAARLAVFAVFVPPDLKNVVEEDDLREEIARGLEDLARQEPPLKHVVVALAAPGDVAAYRLADDAAVTVVPYRRYRVTAVHSLAADKLGPEATGAIVEDAKKLIEAPRK